MKGSKIVSKKRNGDRISYILKDSKGIELQIEIDFYSVHGWGVFTPNAIITREDIITIESILRGLESGNNKN